MSDFRQEQDRCSLKPMGIVRSQFRGDQGIYAHCEMRKYSQPDVPLDTDPILFDLRGLDDHIEGLENLGALDPLFMEDVLVARKQRDALVSTLDKLDRGEIKITDVPVFKYDPRANRVNADSNKPGSDPAQQPERTAAFRKALDNIFPKLVR